MLEVLIIDTRKSQESKPVLIAPEQEPSQECFLGRDDSCCVALDDSLASRIHGKIILREENYYYIDLDSKNGSKVNNAVIQPNHEYCLKTSDTVTLGNHVLWVKKIYDVETSVSSKTPESQDSMPLAEVNPQNLTTWSEGAKLVKCARIVRETATVKTFTFVADPPIKFSYQPGQFVTLNLNIGDEKLKPRYFISSSPSRPHTIEITVEQISSTDEKLHANLMRTNNWLYENLTVGSQIELCPPQGNFTNFANPSPKLLFICEGSGISPLMSMSRWLCDTVSDVEIVLLYSAKTPEEIIFRQELEMMTSRYPKFRLAIAIIEPVLGQPWYGYTGAIDESILQAIAPDYLKRTAFISGSTAFIQAIEKLLAKVGFPKENYSAEDPNQIGQPLTPEISDTPSSDRQSRSLSSLTPLQANKPPIVAPTAIVPPETPASSDSNSPPTSPNSILAAEVPPTAFISSSAPSTDVLNSTVVLLKSGRIIDCNNQQTILSIAEAQGVDLPFGCRQGVCGACTVKKTEGKVIYDRNISCEAGFVRTCVARPVGKVVLEV
ncbi:MAG: FHA domain-containing protein [Cyanobacteria bacterium P01_G01_bin.19]